MQTALENLSKNELIKLARQQLAGQKSFEALEHKAQMQEAEIERLTQERDYLKAQVEMFQRMQFGQKRERFQGDPNQTLLPFEADLAQVEQQQEETKEKIEYVRKRPNHHGRAKLPEHLPVEEIQIHPEGDLSQMVCIGKCS
jgi:transposase